LRHLLFKSDTNTFQPGSRNPRDGLYANTDEMKQELSPPAHFSRRNPALQAKAAAEQRQHMTPNC
jgi:hypothetical protein